MTQKSPTTNDQLVSLNWDNKEMKPKWEAFMKFGNQAATEMTGKNLDKWLKEAGVFDSKHITTTMTGIAFCKVTGSKKKATFSETKEVLIKVAEDRATKSKKPVQDELNMLTQKLVKLKLAPSTKGAAKPVADAGVYSRLTDHTKYTGAHKERFTADGKGKGKEGRVDTKDDSGYVSSYKNKDTYDKLHGK